MCHLKGRANLGLFLCSAASRRCLQAYPHAYRAGQRLALLVGDQALSLDVQIRHATAADIPEILRHRRGMYEAMDDTDADALSGMLSTCKPYLTQRSQTAPSAAGSH